MLETAVRRSKVENGGTILDKCNQIMTYAADMVIMGRRLQEWTEGFASMIEQTNKTGLEIKVKKYKIYYNVTKGLQWKWICKI